MSLEADGAERQQPAEKQVEDQVEETERHAQDHAVALGIRSPTPVGAGVLHIEPQLVARLDGLAMSLQFQGTSIRISILGDELTVLSWAEGFRRPVRIAVRGEVRALGPGESWVVALPA